MEISRIRRERLARGLFCTRIGCFERARGHLVKRDGPLDPLLFLCLEGRGFVEQGGRRLSVTAGDAVWVDCGKPHSYGAERDRPWTIAWTHLGGAEVAAWRNRLTAGGRKLCWHVSDPAAAQRAFEELWQATVLDANPLYSSVCCALWVALLDRNHIDRFGTGSGEAPEERIARELRERPHLARSREDMAGMIGRSPGRFAARFRARWGCPPRHYQIRQRLQRACALLEGSSLKIGAIAAEVGYDNPFYFSRLFRKAFGQSPQAYRARFTAQGATAAKAP